MQGIAQTREVTGVVLDSGSRAPLGNVSVTVRDTRHGTVTDAAGRFRIEVGQDHPTLLFSVSGYAPEAVVISDSTTLPLTIFLREFYQSLNEIVVHSRRKYRNKNNPAVALIRQVIAHKAMNAPTAYPFMAYDGYEKLRILADRPPRWATHNFLMKPYRFLFEHPDSTLVPGRYLVPAYIEETASKVYYRAHPEKKKQVILGRKRVDLGPYVDIEGVSQIGNRLYEDFSIYDNTMQVFTRQFMGPVAELAPDLYMFFIRDTITDDGVRVIRLDFLPRNPQDLLFSGTLFITDDGRYAIRKVEMSAPNQNNLNWVHDFRCTQTFEIGPGGHYYRALARFSAFFSLLPKGRGFYGERSVMVSDVSDSTLPDAVFRGPEVDTTLRSVPQPDSFWVAQRPLPLTSSETRTYINTDSLAKMHSYERFMDAVTLVTAGYLTVGKVDIGHVGSFYSFNTLEGNRYEFGGRTNPTFSTRWFTDDYVAYGTLDRRWKYHLSATYSINHKSIYSYPFHYIQASYVHDVKNPGEEDEFAQDNSFLYSFNRGIGGKWLYSDIVNLSYVREFGDHFSYILGMKYWQQQTAGSLAYVYQPPVAQPDTVPGITTTEVSLTLGWAPHQQFYQGKTTRRVIDNQYPTFTLQYALGIKGLLGGQYNYNAFRLSVSKRWYLAPLGYADLTLSAGYITGNLPFPLLVIEPANPSYYYSFIAYNMMNTEEFVTDHFAGLDVDHYFNGFFFNKIPLLKKLRLREVVAGKILFGGVRPENNPSVNPYQMKFPLNNGVLSTYSLGGRPYIEASVGVANILNILRVDLVHRFTYLDHPGISVTGIRISTGINF